MADDDTRSKILNAAGAAFAEDGFEGTTVRKICDAAGVNLASINYHFGDKARLYVEAIKYAHKFREEQTPLPEWPKGTPALTRLRDFIYTTVQRMLVAAELPWQAQLMFREILNPTGACQELARDVFRPHFTMLLEILRELAPEQFSEEKIYRLGFDVISQCVFYKVHKPIFGMLCPEPMAERMLNPDALAEHIFSTTVTALNTDVAGRVTEQDKQSFIH